MCLVSLCVWSNMFAGGQVHQAWGLIHCGTCNIALTSMLCMYVCQRLNVNWFCAPLSAHNHWTPSWASARVRVNETIGSPAFRLIKSTKDRYWQQVRLKMSSDSAHFFLSCFQFWPSFHVTFVPLKFFHPVSIAWTSISLFISSLQTSDSGNTHQSESLHLRTENMSEMQWNDFWNFFPAHGQQNEFGSLKVGITVTFESSLVWE